MPIRGSIANSLKSFGADRIGGTPPAITGTIDYVMAAGGGGGGFGGGGGGGGGGVLFGSGYPVGPSITLTMQIGGGGGAGSGGGNSTITGPGTPSLTANGGGDGGDGGAGPGNRGGDGGSGGGGGRDTPAPSTTSYGLGTPGQGNRGGRGGNPPQGAAGGGGGANSGGQDGSSGGGGFDNARNGGDGKSPIFYLVWTDVRQYLNAQGIEGGGSWTAPNGRWDDYRIGSGGGNGVDGGPGSNIGLGGSGSSWRGYPHTGGDGGTDSFNGGASRNANSATQYTGSGGGGGGQNPGGGSSPAGGSGSGGTIIIKYDEYFANAASTSGQVLYARQSGYRIFHWLGTGTITF
jgi:hypothetical protein